MLPRWYPGVSALLRRVVNGCRDPMQTRKNGTRNYALLWRHRDAAADRAHM